MVILIQVVGCCCYLLWHSFHIDRNPYFTFNYVTVITLAILCNFGCINLCAPNVSQRQNWHYWHKIKTRHLSYFQINRLTFYMHTVEYSFPLSPMYCIWNCSFYISSHMMYQNYKNRLSAWMFYWLDHKEFRDKKQDAVLSRAFSYIYEEYTLFCSCTY